MDDRINLFRQLARSLGVDEPVINYFLTNRIAMENRVGQKDVLGMESLEPTMTNLVAKQSYNTEPNIRKEVMQSRTEEKPYFDLIKKYFPPEEWDRAYQVMKAESGGRSEAVGDNYPIRGEIRPSYGLFQIRTFPNRPSPKELLNPETNVKYARQLWENVGRKWSPTWSAATKLGYR